MSAFCADLQGLPQSTFAKNAEADSLKRLKGSDARWIIVLEFDPADAFGDPAERVIKIGSRFSHFRDQLFQRFAVDLHLFQKFARDVARWRAGKFGAQAFPEALPRNWTRPDGREGKLLKGRPYFSNNLFSCRQSRPPDSFHGQSIDQV